MNWEKEKRLYIDNIKREESVRKTVKIMHA